MLLNTALTRYWARHVWTLSQTCVDTSIKFKATILFLTHGDETSRKSADTLRIDFQPAVSRTPGPFWGVGARPSAVYLPIERRRNQTGRDNDNTRRAVEFNEKSSAGERAAGASYILSTRVSVTASYRRPPAPHTHLLAVSRYLCNENAQNTFQMPYSAFGYSLFADLRRV